MELVGIRSWRDIAGIFLFLVLWGGAVAYLAATGGDWTFPLIALGVFGIALSLVAWVTTIGAKPPPIDVARPKTEALAVFVFLAVYALVFLGWALGVVREAFPDERTQEGVVLGVKLVVHVVLPALVLLALGARLAPLFAARVGTRAFWLTLIVLGAAIIGLLAVVSPSLRNLAELQPAWTLLAWIGPASFLWIALEAGLCEEFLYRAVLQTRLEALFKSAWAGVIGASILFGLAHAPGLYLRGGPGVDGWSTDVWQVIAFTISTLVPLSLFFGFVYVRTRSLLLVVLLHACVDVLPNLSGFIRTWAP